VPMAELKLIALDADDLAVLSAHLQDAVIQVADIAYLPKERRFAAIGNRFDWMAAAEAREGYARRRAALRFERVLGAQVQSIDLSNKSLVLSLLALTFEPTSAPEGYVTLHFADSAAIRLHVECVEAEMKDLGPVWRVDFKPQHPDGSPISPSPGQDHSN
jgi:Protein of unknown function (DUF2948)